MKSSCGAANPRNRRKGAGWSARALLAALAALTPRAEAREREQRFSIAERPLADALVAFAVQADISISTPPDGLGGARAHAVRGQLEPRAALRQLLAGTDFTFVQIDSVTFRIVPDHVRAAEGAGMSPPSDEIIVTARRRPEALDRVPASASVVSSAQLEQLGVDEAEDTAFVAAGLNFTNLGPGRNKIMFRGLSDGAFNGRTQSTVGAYLDDSRISYTAPDPDLLLADVEAVEILRGPQGALFGAGSIAGVYRIITRAPDLETFEASVMGATEITRGGDLGGEVRGLLNLPVAPERLGVRVLGYRDVAGGWLDNSVLGLRNTNRTTRRGLRLTALARLSDDWTVTARALYQSIDSSDSQYIDEAVGDLARTAKVLEPHDNDFRMASASVRGALPFGQFTSTTTFLRHGRASRYDATAALAHLGVDPASIAAFDETELFKFVTEEAQIVGVASSNPWSVGAFVSIGQSAGDDVLTADLGQPAPLQAYASARRDEIREYAVYGSYAWRIEPNLALELGARAFQTNIATSARADAAAANFTDNFVGRSGELGLVPELQLSYEPAQGEFYYFRFAEGYRGGGFNTGSASILDSTLSPGSQPARRYGPDRLWNLELGGKRAFLDGRLRVHSVVFWEFWENAQTDQLLANGLPFTGNVGDGQNPGFELESTFEISPDTNIAAHWTYSVPEIINSNATFPGSSDAGFPGAPHLLVGVTLTSNRDLGAWGQLGFSAGLLYVGHSDITFADAANVAIGGYFDSNLRLSLDRERWRASIYIDNVTETDATTFSFGNPFRFGDASLVTPLRPRTFGISLERRFD